MTYTVNSTNARTAVSAAERELRNGLDDGSLAEIEIAWSDPFGHAQGKRIPASQFLNRALGSGFAFCEASLGWNTDGTVIDSLRLTNWVGGYPDVYAVPDFSTYRADAMATPGRPCHLRYRCARSQPVTAGSPRGTQEGARTPCLARLHRQGRRRVRVLSTQRRTARRFRTTSTPTHWRTPTPSIRCSATSMKR